MSRPVLLLLALVSTTCGWGLDPTGERFACVDDDECPAGSSCTPFSECWSVGGEVLLEDSFDDGIIDESRWLSGATSHGFGGGLWDVTEVVDVDGFLRFFANTGHHDNTHCQEVWLTSQRDLRVGRALRIDLTLAASNQNGGSYVAITSYPADSPRMGCAVADGCVKAMGNNGVANEVSTFAPTHLSIFVRADGTLRTEPSLAFRVNNEWLPNAAFETLSSLDAWYLRVWVESNSSTDYYGFDNEGKLLGARVTAL